MDVAIKRGEDPSSRCKLMAAGSKYMISVEIIAEKGQYCNTNRKLSVVRVVENLKGVGAIRDRRK